MRWKRASANAVVGGGGLSRRDVLRLGGGAGGLLVATSLNGCGFFSTDPEAKKSGGNKGGAGGSARNEAPDLAEMVDAGDLPPLKERLPREPLVVEPADRIGVYGGTWNNALLGTSDTPWLGRTIGGENPLRFNPTAENIVPNLAASMEVSDDAREYTITLREGLRWSDGEPFTADDVLFAWEDVITNEDLSPIMTSYLTSDGDPASLEQEDDWTFRLVFPKPNGLYYVLSTMRGDLIAYPKHYLTEFHLSHNPDVETIAEEGDYDDWMAYFWEKNNEWENVDRPTLNAWYLTQALGDGNRVLFERNPYYWKTDPEGNQLPYIDSVQFEIVQEEEVILLKGTSGDLDMTTRHINSLQNKPVLGDAREEGKFHFVDLENTVMNDMVIAFNLTHKDEVQREVYQTKDFRVALSHGINRQELADAVWQRQGIPWQAAPDDRSRFYDEELALQYTEHDVDKANQLLDSIGLDERDGDGFRLRPDGKRLVVTIAVASPALIPMWPEAAEMVTSHWEAIGIKGRLDVLERSLFYERKDWQANQQDTTVWTGDGGLHIEVVEPRWYFPFSGESNFALPWAQWFSSRGEEGTEPPEAPKQQMQLYWDLIRASTDDERDDLFREILQIAKEQFYCVGTIRVPTSYGIVKNNMHNVPELIPEGATLNTPALANTSTWFFEGEA